MIIILILANASSEVFISIGCNFGSGCLLPCVYQMVHVQVQFSKQYNLAWSNAIAHTGVDNLATSPYLHKSC